MDDVFETLGEFFAGADVGVFTIRGADGIVGVVFIPLDGLTGGASEAGRGVEVETGVAFRGALAMLGVGEKDLG